MIKLRRRACDIPMASMSDIAFLLIIFFITSISFMYRQGIRISLPKKDAAPTVLPASSILTLRLDKDGALFAGKTPVTCGTIPLRGETAAIVQVDRRCPYRYVVGAMEALQKKEMTRISVKKL